MSNINKHAAAARSHDATINEGGEGYNPHWAKHDAAVKAAVEARMADLVVRADEVRAAWNAAVQKYAVNGQVRALDLPKIEAAAGVTRNELMLLKSRLAGK